MFHKLDPPYTPARVAQLFNLVHSELMGQSMETLLQFLQRANLSMPRLVSLMHIQRQREATISSLSEHLNLSPATTSQMIDQLVQDGLVERREAPHDRRQKLISLTPAGEAVVAEARQIRLNEASRSLSKLPPELLSQLGQALSAACREWQLTAVED
ncbi:MarR family winged helix-turn-helix transcriptional regulator [Chloroflexus sp.]|uniref:MarR family winged helix-turn-helix transcriptional regulator n=1 Tax=Chloroflexus sp. TaxID=1904827 RepID=UPI00260EA6A3|nr:MarR family transcriptional regulator [uncultured Chloroflexus sp.]